MIKKNEHTCRWRVEFRELAYDGGGSESWVQYYWTKIGALWSKHTHLHIRSWGGLALLTRTDKDYTTEEMDTLWDVEILKRRC